MKMSVILTMFMLSQAGTANACSEWVYLQHLNTKDPKSQYTNQLVCLDTIRDEQPSFKLDPSSNKKQVSKKAFEDALSNFKKQLELQSVQGDPVLNVQIQSN